MPDEVLLFENKGSLFVQFSDEEKKNEETEENEEEPSPRLPAGVPRGVGGLPGLGGVNMMAELKAKQEKRKSLVSVKIEFNK